MGLVQACRIIDADQIVLGGSVAALYPLMAARVARTSRRRRNPASRFPSITMNDEGTVGSAFGAACMLHQRYLSLESQRFADERVESKSRIGQGLTARPELQADHAG